MAYDGTFARNKRYSERSGLISHLSIDSNAHKHTHTHHTSAQSSSRHSAPCMRCSFMKWAWPFSLKFFIILLLFFSIALITQMKRNTQMTLVRCNVGDVFDQPTYNHIILSELSASSFYELKFYCSQYGASNAAQAWRCIAGLKKEQSTEK